jgi:hypothetical protein
MTEKCDFCIMRETKDAIADAAMDGVAGTIHISRMHNYDLVSLKFTGMPVRIFEVGDAYQETCTCEEEGELGTQDETDPEDSPYDICYDSEGRREVFSIFGSFLDRVRERGTGERE